MVAWSELMYIEAMLIRRQCTTQDWKHCFEHAGNSEDIPNQRIAEDPDRLGI